MAAGDVFGSFHDCWSFVYTQSTSPSAAVAALTMLSATKVSTPDIVMARPLALFAADDDNEALTQSQSSTRFASTCTTISDGGLSIEILELAGSKHTRPTFAGGRSIVSRESRLRWHPRETCCPWWFNITNELQSHWNGFLSAFFLSMHFSIPNERKTKE